MPLKRDILFGLAPNLSETIWHLEIIYLNKCDPH